MLIMKRTGLSAKQIADREMIQMGLLLFIKCRSMQGKRRNDRMQKKEGVMFRKERGKKARPAGEKAACRRGGWEGGCDGERRAVRRR